MTPVEFKAWFEGFTEAMSGTPTKAQWARIKERVGQIDGTKLTYETIRYYWPNYTWSNSPATTRTVYWGGAGSGVGLAGQGSGTTNAYTLLANCGRNEAKSLAA